jgi:hypothetical protein
VAGKRQVVVPGGLRKVIETGGGGVAGTTIAEIGSQVVTLAQLKVLLGIVTPAGGSSGGSGNSTASILAGAGLLGGGAVIGTVPLYLAQSTPPVIWNDALLPDDFVGGASSGGSGGGGGGSTTLAGLSDVSIATPTAGQVLAYNGVKWQNEALPTGTAAGGPTLVQKTYFRWQGPPSSAGTTTLTFGATPTVGNVMLLISEGYDTSSSSFLTIPSGWTKLAYFNVNNTEGIMVAFRVVQSGDGTTYTVGGGNGGNAYGMYEFANVLNITALSAIPTGAALVATSTVEVQPNAYNIGVTTTDAISLYASMTGATLLFDGTSAGTGTNNHPGVFFQPTVMGNVAITFTGANMLFPNGAIISVDGPPGGSGVPTGSMFASQGMKGASTTANTASAYQAMILAESTLVAYWPFSDAAGATAVKDVKGTNNGTLTNQTADPILFNAPGRIGATCAYIANGQFFTNGTVTVNRPVQDDFTLEAWILVSTNITGASGANWYQNEGIIGFDVSGTTNDFGLGLNNGNTLNGGTGNPDVTATSTKNLLDGVWHHVAMTRTKSTGVSVLYVDGVQVGTVTGGTQSLNAATTIQIGGFQGFIADVAAYSSVLTLSDIQAHVAAGSPGSGAAITTVPNATAVPGTIPDLLFWFESDNILGTNGVPVYAIGNRVPWANGFGASVAATSNVTVASALLNSLPVLAWSGSSNGRTTLFGSGFTLSAVTVFALYNPASLTSPASPTLFSGGSGAFQLRTTSTGQVEIAKSNVAVIGDSTGSSIAVGTWAQFNVTYNASTGAFAFRVARAAAGSGTNVQSITAPSTAIGWDPGNGGQDLNGSLAALIVFGRVLTGSEITLVENYLHSKWGI